MDTSDVIYIHFDQIHKKDDSKRITLERHRENVKLNFATNKPNNHS